MMRLRRREKFLAGGLLIFVTAWSLLVMAINPAVDRIETLNRVISEKQQELEDVRIMSKELIYLNHGLDYLHTKVDSQGDTLELLPFMESLIEESGLTANIETMNRQVLPIDPDYSEVVVEVRLESLSIGRLVDFLGKIESLKAKVKTKSIYIKRNTVNKNLLDVVIEVYNTELSQYEFARN
jgi:hypothetical protein